MIMVLAQKVMQNQTAALEECLHPWPTPVGLAWEVPPQTDLSKAVVWWHDMLPFAEQGYQWAKTSFTSMDELLRANPDNSAVWDVMKLGRDVNSRELVEDMPLPEIVLMKQACVITIPEERRYNYDSEGEI